MASHGPRPNEMTGARVPAETRALQLIKSIVVRFNAITLHVFPNFVRYLSV